MDRHVAERRRKRGVHLLLVPHVEILLYKMQSNFSLSFCPVSKTRHCVDHFCISIVLMYNTVTFRGGGVREEVLGTGTKEFPFFVVFFFSFFFFLFMTKQY